MRKLTAMILVGAALAAVPSIAGADGLNIVFTHHSSGRSTGVVAVFGLAAGAAGGSA